MRRTTRALLTAVLAGPLAFAAGAGPVAAAPGADLTGYIVVLKDAGADPAGVAGRYAREHGAQTGFVYTAALKGFSAKLSGSAVRALRTDPAVAYVEPDAVAHMHAQETASGVRRIFAADNPGLKVGDGNDERVDADVAIIDTGVDFDHPDLNVVKRTNCLNTTSCTDNTGADDNHHGSNVAGIVGELDNGIGYVGVAPGARLWGVRVLDQNGSGNATGIVAGIDWVAARAADIEVANLSLGFTGTVQSVNDAVNNLIAKGVVVTVSAGNGRRDVSGVSPANVPDAITVSNLSDSDGKPGGTGPDFKSCNPNNNNKDDTLRDDSNFGAGVDIIAPGDCIKSTGKEGGYSNYSGTSQSAPHVAGAAAWLASGTNKPKNRDDVLKIRNTLVAKGNSNWTDTSNDGVKEPLLDVSDQATFPPGGSTPPPGDPTAKFTSSCTGLSCSFDGSGSSDPDGTISSWAWDFGDGATGTGGTVSHAYASAGTYTVKLTVTDNSGKTGTTSASVTVGGGGSNKPPTAAIDRYCGGPSCGFGGYRSSDPEGKPLTYKWSFGDGTSGTGVQTSHRYPDATATYTVTLTVTDDQAATGTATTTVNCTKGQYGTTCR